MTSYHDDSPSPDLHSRDLPHDVHVLVVEAGGTVAKLVVVILQPPAELSHDEVVVEAGRLVEGVPVHPLDLHHRLVPRVVPDGVHQDLVTLLKGFPVLEVFIAVSCSQEKSE